MKVYYEQDADLAALKDKTVAVLGYGSQGHAHAQNLRDSGLEVVVGQRPGSANFDLAREHGFHPVSVAEAAGAADLIMLLLPDQHQADVYQKDILAHLTKGKALAFAHGFSIHYNQIAPPAGVDVFLIAPKAPGLLVRQTYTQGGGTPALVAIHQDATGNSLALALAYAKGLGCARAGVMETSFREETETDLFGEQAVLCGGLMALVRNGYDVLVRAGYAPEMAYFECLHELKLIVDLLYTGGFVKMCDSISDTAEYGTYTAGPRVINRESQKAMEAILADIQNGTFARDFVLENKAGMSSFKAMRRMHAAHPMEEVGERLRAMMPWLNKV